MPATNILVTHMLMLGTVVLEIRLTLLVIVITQVAVLFIIREVENTGRARLVHCMVSSFCRICRKL